MGKNALQFRTEVDFPIVQAVIQGLDAHAVTGQDQAFFGLHPHGDGKHPTEAREARASPTLEGVQNYFCVTLGAEVEALPFQLRSNFAKIENLSVEDNDNVLVSTDKRLIAILEIENAQPGCAQGDLA